MRSVRAQKDVSRDSSEIMGAFASRAAGPLLKPAAGGRSSSGAATLLKSAAGGRSSSAALLKAQSAAPPAQRSYRLATGEIPLYPEPLNRTLLWIAASGDREPEAAACLPERLGAEESRRLVEAAVREGLAGLLYQRLRACGRLAMLAAPSAQRLESIYYLTLQTNLRYFSVLKEIAGGGVPFVVMQGAALLAEIYPDPGLRPLGDIDLWVLPGNRERLVAGLVRLGFRETSLAPGVFRRGDVLVDTHVQLDWTERIRASRFLFAVDLETVHRACRRVSWDGLELLCLGKYDQVIYLTVHAIKHNLERLIWLADIQRLVARWQTADWEELRRRARQLGQEKVVPVLAYLRQALFGMRTPAAALAGLNLSALDRYLLRMRKRGPLPKWSSLTLLSAGNCLRRLEFAFESTFPRPEILRQVFADRNEQSDRRLYGLRIRQLLGMIKS